jgi:chromosome segregation ATPase
MEARTHLRKSQGVPAAPEGRDTMRMREWMKAAAIVAGLCLVGMPSYAQQQSSSQQTGDPVADAARKAREEKKNAQKPKKVFTDDDVKHSGTAGPEKPAETSGAEGAAATTTAGTQKTESATKKEDATAKEDPNSEKAWRKRFSEQHAKIARAEKELDVLQRELEKTQVQYYADPQKAMNEQNNRAEVNEKRTKIADKKKELDQLRQELDDMETQLRKSGGDPGWAQ